MPESRKALHIVAGKNEMKYAQMVFALISSNDNIECKIFNDPNFYCKEMSTDNYTLFIGANKAISKNMTAMLDMRYDKFGIKYASHGKVSQIWRENILWDFKKVMSFSKEYDSKITTLKKLNIECRLKIAFELFLCPIIASPLLNGYGMIESFKALLMIKDAQYNYGIMLWVENEFRNFLELEASSK